MNQALGIFETSLRGQLLVVGTVLIVILLLPVLGLAGATNLSALGSSSSSVVGIYTGPNYPGDTYAFGNCTYWVFMRRGQVGEPIPTTWGNAATWAVRAAADDYTVDHTPAPYAIMQTPDVDNGLGHVAFVESVDPDGTWHISEMNVIGFDEIDDKAMPASAAAGYNFIH